MTGIDDRGPGAGGDGRPEGPNVDHAQKSEARPPLHSMITMLCIVSGAMDAIGFLALGDAFASVMTGNIVILGLAGGMLDQALALLVATAILGYVLGVVVGSWVCQRWKRRGDYAIWPRRVTKALVLELVVLVVTGLVWLYLEGDPSDVARFALLFCVAWTMGFQGAAVRAIGVPVSTTYMTGALTTLLEAVVTRRPFSPAESTAVGGLSALALGALLASVVLTVMSAAAFAVPATALAVVLLLAIRFERSRSRT